jgi:hypothetical protein
MSDCETEYEHRGYQRIEYYDSDNGMDREEQYWAEATEDAGELPEMVTGLSADTLEAGCEQVEGEESGQDAAALPATDVRTSAGPVSMGNACLPSEVLDILRARWASWKEARANQWKKHWTTIVAELQELALHKVMEKPELDQRLKVGGVLLKRFHRHDKIPRHACLGCTVKAKRKGLVSRYTSERSGLPEQWSERPEKPT